MLESWRRNQHGSRQDRCRQATCSLDDKMPPEPSLADIATSDDSIRPSLLLLPAMAAAAAATITTTTTAAAAEC